MESKKIEPNYRCPDLPPWRLESELNLEATKLYCQCGLWCYMAWSVSCLEGSGTCTFNCFDTYVEGDTIGSCACTCFYSYDFDTCGAPEGTPTHHAGDIPRTVWYDYNMAGLEGVFMEHWKREDQKIVMRFANKTIGGRIHVLVDPEFWLPGMDIFF